MKKGSNKTGGGLEYKKETRVVSIERLIGKRVVGVSAKTKVAHRVADIVHNSIEQNLLGNPDKPYKPLSPDYAERKKKIYGDVPILYRTGKSIEQIEVKPTNDGTKTKVLKVKITAPEHMFMHNDGGDVLPKREWIKVKKDDKREIKEELSKR